ncbi:hypothetical protein LshimejAT787_0605050 [Lyophyllum shimeji]|uniref:Uncharacterized protein n=1 Tax=Lyophyllum shimeji TaxID=47721 RepID=A0A9P3PNW4_LYOSH|nr:hypothetical protein LshimejAT787_0605050 [Lyophyllum shimeji]
MSEPSSAPSAPSIAPVLLKDLEFGDAEKKNDVLAKLISLARENPTFTSEHISARAAELLRILKLPQTQEHRTALVQFISALFYLTPASRALLAPHADAIVPYLVPCYTTECLHVQYALSRLAEDDPASHAASLRTHLYYAHPGPEVVRGAVESRGPARSLLSKPPPRGCDMSPAGLPPDDPRRRPVSGGRVGPRRVRGDVVLRVGVGVGGRGDSDARGAGEGPGGAQGARAREKPRGGVATGPHWLLARVVMGLDSGDGEGEQAMVREAFEGVWKDAGLGVLVKLGIAVEAGLCDLLLEEVGRGGASEHRSAVLVVLEKLVGEARSAGYFLMKKGCIEPLLDIVKGPVPADSALALSILARLLESTSPSPGTFSEPIPLRDTVAAALTSPSVLPRIIARFHCTSSRGAAHLLAEILAGEPGTNAWDYSPSSGPPSTPYKGKLVTSDVVARSVELIRMRTARTDALLLLYQCGWGYKRGLELVKYALKAAVENVDVFFFPALAGGGGGANETLETMTLGRTVAEAAYLAGALPRALELLAQEAASEAAGRRAAVDGVCFVLRAPSAQKEKDVVRRNEVLLRVLAALVADESRASLERVVWMLRLLENTQDRDQRWLLERGESFGNGKTVGHLVALVQQVL